jgi:hypothetical protein
MNETQMPTVTIAAATPIVCFEKAMHRLSTLRRRNEDERFAGWAAKLLCSCFVGATLVALSMQPIV